MKSSAAVLAELNKALRESLTAINQYFLHARMAKNWGYHELDERIYKQSIGEMKCSDRLIQRIFLLEGLPNLQDLGRLMVGESVPEILSCDLKLEQRKHGLLTQAILICEQEQDFVSRELLVAVKDDNEEHIDWLETQQNLVAEMGRPNYLQSLC